VNKAADALSRSPVENKQVLHVEMEITGLTMKRVQEAQREDPELLQLIAYLESNRLPEDGVLAKHIVSQAVKGYCVIDGILYYEDGMVPNRRRLVVPTKLRRQILLDNHESLFAGHFATKKLLQRVNQYYYRPRMSVDAHQVCESCVTCLSTQGQQRRPRPPSQCIPVGEPFECIGMDFKELDISHNGNRYALVFQDYLTKWLEVFPVADRTARTVYQPV